MSEYFLEKTFFRRQKQPVKQFLNLRRHRRCKIVILNIFPAGRIGGTFDSDPIRFLSSHNFDFVTQMPFKFTVNNDHILEKVCQNSILFFIWASCFWEEVVHCYFWEMVFLSKVLLRAVSSHSVTRARSCKEILASIQATPVFSALICCSNLSTNQKA